MTPLLNSKERAPAPVLAVGDGPQMDEAAPKQPPCPHCASAIRVRPLRPWEHVAIVLAIIAAAWASVILAVILVLV